jgi:multisubunit Na+/H+ antiporter MnhF subunit
MRNFLHKNFCTIPHAGRAAFRVDIRRWRLNCFFPEPLTWRKFMNIRIVFGYLFFLLSVVFCAFQLITLPTAENLEGGRLALQFCTTFVCLVLASLAAQSGHKTAMIGISLVAFTVSFLALLSSGILAMKGAGGMAPIKYAIFLAYGGLYGIFGLAFSLVAGKSAKAGVDKEA